MRNSIWPLLAIVLAVPVAACGGDDDDDGGTGGSGGSETGGSGGSETGGSGGSAGSGLQNGPGKFADDYKTSADFFTFMSAPVAGSSPHGTVQIWYSTNIKSLKDTSTFTVPEGTVSIKEVYGNSAGSLDGYAVMVKKEAGYDTTNNDWYYEMRDADGNVKTNPPAGKIAGCIGCHSAAKGKDYLAGWDLR
ncbi:MAG: cytochrome P460 family protein [Polyangiaceae bacterium]|nr:cytochrome P460 family protein [Polyangiaceae bacterium]